jgi:hypothetical protein
MTPRGAGSHGEPNRLQGQGTRSFSPEEHIVFRLAQLILLLKEVAPPSATGIGLERLGYYDFFSANPFLVVSEEDPKGRAILHLAGFDERQLSYTSTGPRFANRRQRLQHDLALLVAYELVSPRSDGWGLTSRGSDLCSELTALYAQQYRTSVGLVVTQLKKLSDAALAREAARWLRSPTLILDLYGAPSSDEGDDVDSRSVAGQGQRDTGDRT